ncbi:O-antigen ligase family protein [Agarivorans sp. Z349TD_8]|uniref:O-antigen ligase family protein n=1 Tax=Agarivorans sp. Z349TD_8 TaxID=3421434 RepID=UPI003D7E36B1
MDMFSPKTERFAFGLLLLLVVWLPIPLASNRPWAWSIMEGLIALQSLILVYCWRQALPWGWLKTNRFLLLGLGILQLVALAQLLPLSIDMLSLLSGAAASFRELASVSVEPLSEAPLSLDPNRTLVNLVMGCSYLLLAVNCCLLLNCRERMQVLMLAFVVSGTFQAFYGTMLILSDVAASPVFEIPTASHATGSFVYKNHFANYLILCLCMSLSLVVSELNSQQSSSWQQFLKRILEAFMSRKMLIRLCMVIMVIGLVMSRSRMGNSAFFVSTIIGACFALVLFRKRPRTLTVFFVSILLIDVLIVSSLFGLDNLRERLSSTVLAEEERVAVFDWSLNMLQDFFITGSGAGSFYALFQNYAPQPLAQFYDHAHNDYLQFSIEYGVFATAVLGAAVLWTLIRCLIAIRKRMDPLMRATALGCMMAIVAMLIHISVDFNLQAPANAASFIIVLCLGMVAATMPTEGHLRDV